MILSLDTQRDIRNAALSALHYIAFDQHCEVSDILVLLSTTADTSISGPDTAPAVVLSTTPSQLDPKQAAPSAATAPGGVTAEVSPASDTSETGGEEPSILPVTPQSDIVIPISDEPQPTLTPAVQAQNVGSSSEVLDGPSHSLPGAERAADPAPSLPPRGRPETTRAQVVACHHANPSWPSKLIAEHLSISEDAVRATASRKKLKLVSWWDYQRAEAAKKAAGLVAPAQSETPPAAPVEAVIEAALAKLPSPPTTKAPTLQERIVAVRAEHPDWPYRVVAKHLGAPKNSVQAYASVLGFTWPSQTEYDAAHANDAEPVVEPPKRETITDRLRSYVADHPDATLRDVSDALGVKQTSIGYAANNAGIVLRKYTAEERSAATSRGIQARLAAEAAAQPQIPPEDEAEPALTAPYSVAPKIAKRAPQGRFYLRDSDGRFVHQSLQASPTGPGPLMTSDRKWGWYDTMERYRGAKKLWPQLAFMRKDAVHA